MFVTKLDVVCALGDTTERPRAGVGRTSLEPKTSALQAVEPEHSRTVAFAFDALEHLLCVCRRLLAQDFSGGSAAYRLPLSANTAYSKTQKQYAFTYVSTAVRFAKKTQ